MLDQFRLYGRHLITRPGPRAASSLLISQSNPLFALGQPASSKHREIKSRRFPSVPPSPLLRLLISPGKKENTHTDFRGRIIVRFIDPTLLKQSLFVVGGSFIEMKINIVGGGYKPPPTSHLRVLPWLLQVRINSLRGVSSVLLII